MIVLVTGGFDPIHSGHLSLFREAKKMGTHLVVGVNSDMWLRRKKGKYFMPLEERMAVVSELKSVDEVITFNDEDNTACDAIEQCLKKYGEILFCNGGDRHNENTPEFNKYQNEIQFRWGVGGLGKQNSSSAIISTFLEQDKTERSWGYYRVLCEGVDYKVKELVINPHSSLSMQKHQHRSETWNLISGEASIKSLGYETPLEIDTSYTIQKDTWHQGVNKSDQPAHIVEVWRGKTSELKESDIMRISVINGGKSDKII